jgi:hypothetical protein
MSPRRVEGRGWAQVTIRLDEEVEKQLRGEAERRVVGFSFLINRLLRDALGRLPPLPGEEPYIIGGDERPHSRACGWQVHKHGYACHVSCPTCAGLPDGADG